MKKIIVLIFIVLIFGVTFYYREDISNFLVNIFSHEERKVTVLKNNEYSTNQKYLFVKKTSDFYPKSKEDIKNIYYTIIDSGMNDFTFYCDKSYKECLDDVDDISNDQVLLSHFNNFVHIYNNFKNIDTEFDTLGRVTVHITRSYTEDEIKEINEKFEEIIKDVIKEDTSDDIKVKAFHDYVINHTKYDSDKSDGKMNTHHSDIAYGALVEGYAVCGGYSDSMKLFLDYYNIPNFKISSENHIWNALYIKDRWLHIDLTWDDPVTSSGEDILDYTYFLITTDELLEIEKEQHGFDYNVYLELKEN